MSEIKHIVPRWDISDFKKLDYTLSTHRDSDLVENYVESGHNRDKLSIYKYQMPNPMPDCVEKYIVPKFNFLQSVGSAINYFKPGQYLPLHNDLYGMYLKINNVKSKNVVRYMVMLEDSSPGQILQIKNKCISSWKSGDCFHWQYDDVHAFYNFSMKDRYAVQITGIIDEK